MNRKLTEAEVIGMLQCIEDHTKLAPESLMHDIEARSIFEQLRDLDVVMPPVGWMQGWHKLMPRDLVLTEKGKRMLAGEV